LKKAICIKDGIFDFGSSYGGFKIEVKKDSVWNYYKDNFGYNIQQQESHIIFHNGKHIGTFYPIQIGFSEYFIDIEDYRNDKIEQILK